MGELVHGETAADSQQELRDEPRAAGPSLSLHAQVMRLQRTIGNRAVGQLGVRMLARQPVLAPGGGPSRLVGLDRVLKWDDYKGARAPATAPPNALAATRSEIDRRVGGALPGTASFEGSGGAFKLKDSVVITVSINPISWKSSAVAALPYLEDKLLLEHEQGHYNIAALLARDQFIEIMALKGRTFASQAEGARALAAITSRYDADLTKVDNLYDDKGETDHIPWVKVMARPVEKSDPQKKWERYIDKAFTQERSTGETAPNGAAYKVQLVDVLKQAGHTI